MAQDAIVQRSWEEPCCARSETRTAESLRIPCVPWHYRDKEELCVQIDIESRANQHHRPPGYPRPRSATPHP